MYSLKDEEGNKKELFPLCPICKNKIAISISKKRKKEIFKKEEHMVITRLICQACDIELTKNTLFIN